MHTAKIVIASLLLSGPAWTREGSSPEAKVRSAVERSLRFLVEKGVAWIGERGCVTCHQTTFLIWTHNEARRRGFAVAT